MLWFFKFLNDQQNVNKDKQRERLLCSKYMDRSLPKSLPLECHFYPVRQWNADLGQIQVFPLPCCQ